MPVSAPHFPHSPPSSLRHSLSRSRWVFHNASGFSCCCCCCIRVNVLSPSTAQSASLPLLCCCFRSCLGFNDRLPVLLRCFFISFLLLCFSLSFSPSLSYYFYFYSLLLLLMMMVLFLFLYSVACLFILATTTTTKTITKAISTFDDCTVNTNV